MKNDFILSIIIPVYNEEETIRQAVEAVLATPYRKEIIVIDDGSTDGTAEVLTALDHPDVRVVTHPVNSGKGSALRTGFWKATGDIMLIQDADLEYDPSDYGRLIEPIARDVADMVYGSRFTGGTTWKDMYLLQYLGNRVLTALTNLFSPIVLTDAMTCYKVFRGPLVRNLDIREKRFGADSEITAKVARMDGVRFVEVPIAYRQRSYGAGKKIGWRDGLRIAWCIIRYNIFPRRSEAFFSDKQGK